MKTIQIEVINKTQYNDIRNILSNYIKDNCDGCKVPSYPCYITIHLYWNMWFTNHLKYLLNKLYSYQEFVEGFDKYINSPIK